MVGATLAVALALVGAVARVLVAPPWQRYNGRVHDIP